MKIRTKFLTLFVLPFFITCSNFASLHGVSNAHLQTIYEEHCNTWSDIYQHIPVLCQLARECESVTEIGIRSIISTWGVLKGLSESAYFPRYYVGIDISFPPADRLDLAKKLAEENGINFEFWCENDMNIQIEQTDMLFIDSLHTYCHLTYELETFSPQVKKYICMHDTSAPWGHQDDSTYHGDYTEYPESYNRTKRGLWPAVEDFLAGHPEWELFERLENNHGFTILVRR